MVKRTATLQLTRPRWSQIREPSRQILHWHRCLDLGERTGVPRAGISPPGRGVAGERPAAEVGDEPVLPVVVLRVGSVVVNRRLRVGVQTRSAEQLVHGRQRESPSLGLHQAPVAEQAGGPLQVGFQGERDVVEHDARLVRGRAVVHCPHRVGECQLWCFRDYQCCRGHPNPQTLLLQQWQRGARETLHRLFQVTLGYVCPDSPPAKFLCC